MQVTVAALQYACTADRQQNTDKAESLVREAARQGANIILLQEMFADVFFANDGMKPEHFARAEMLSESRGLARMRSLAKELGVVLPVNFFERAGQNFYNSTLVIDADGRDLGVYRKMHIPMGPPSCFEKYYFSPGDLGFRVFETAFGRIGCAICWDQWFPETARIMALKGAEILFYPTAIGSDCHDHWEIAMRGHAAVNMLPVVASNRIGSEVAGMAGAGHETHFWGQSFICDQRGALLARAGQEEAVIVASFDLAENRANRAEWAVFRDRRPDTYGSLVETN